MSEWGVGEPKLRGSAECQQGAKGRHSYRGGGRGMKHGNRRQGGGRRLPRRKAKTHREHVTVEGKESLLRLPRSYFSWLWCVSLPTLDEQPCESGTVRFPLWVSPDCTRHTREQRQDSVKHTHTHTPTHAYIHTYTTQRNTQHGDLRDFRQGVSRFCAWFRAHKNRERKRNRQRAQSEKATKMANITNRSIATKKKNEKAHTSPPVLSQRRLDADTNTLNRHFDAHPLWRHGTC